MSASVHRFLTNIDVVHAVFGHLDLFPSPITEIEPLTGVTDEALVSRRTLSNAAVTCRAFTEPASKTLWTSLHVGLLPLLKTFSCLIRKNIKSKDPFSLKPEISYVSLTSTTQSRCFTHADANSLIKSGPRWRHICRRMRQFRPSRLPGTICQIQFPPI